MPSLNRRMAFPVYPRWRGEHIREIEAPNVTDGLSPLARGTLPWPAELTSAGRFIPAGAGNTLNSHVAVAVSAVYPRWRGEHQEALLTRTVMLGLSPLARGTLIA